MRSYLYYSCVAHGVFLALVLVLGALLSKPKMGYYSVDLMSSLPSGGGGGGADVTEDARPAPKAIAVPKAPPAPKAPAVKAPPTPRSSDDDLPDQDTIRMLAKLKKKRLAQPKSGSYSSDARPGDIPSPSSAEQAAGSRGGPGVPGGGSGLVAEAGTPFPFPWYLKAIADKLDKNWKPPQEFDPDTMCQVTFVIDRSGQISGTKLSKTSRDSLFDQLALRAVEYSNPMPPLPNGFPDDSLKVHMKFVGKSY